MGFVFSICIVFVLGLIALKLIAAGLTATLLGVGILNLCCVLGGLVSWEEEHSETKRARSKAPVGVTAIIDKRTILLKSPLYTHPRP